MRLFIDKDTRKFVTSASFNSNVTSVGFKRGDSYNLEIGFVEDNALTQLSGSPVITFGIKQNGDYDGDFLVSESSWTWDATNSVYVGAPDFNTTELNTLLGHDASGNATTDVASITAMAEITWHTGDAAWASTNTIDAVIYHDVIGGSEGAPTTGTPAYPAATDVMTLSTAQTAAGAKTFSSDIALSSASLGTVAGPATAVFVGDAALGTTASVFEVRSADLLSFRDITAADGTFNGNVTASAAILTGSAPTGASASGTSGEIRVDDSYFYVCTATNTWKRAAISTW